MVKGMIIAESLTDHAVLDSALFRVTERYPFMMDGRDSVEIVMVEVAPSATLEALALIAGALAQRRYYAHFVDGETMHVVFPSTIVVVRQGHPDDETACLAVAASRDIPPAQLPFGRMFRFIHAERSQPAQGLPKLWPGGP